MTFAPVAYWTKVQRVTAAPRGCSVSCTEIFNESSLISFDFTAICERGCQQKPSRLNQMFSDSRRG